MKTVFDPKRYIPLGKNWQNQQTGLLWGFAWCIITTFSILSNYVDARRALYEYVDKTRQLVLVESRTIVPYWSLVEVTAVSGLIVFLVAMGLLVSHNYRHHRTGSMSIYLMKRLPDKWELHRRCWTVPIAASVIAAVLVAVMIGLFYIVYLTCTPAVCLP